jgi:hypothetical protein
LPKIGRGQVTASNRFRRFSRREQEKKVPHQETSLCRCVAICLPSAETRPRGGHLAPFSAAQPKENNGYLRYIYLYRDEAELLRHNCLPVAETFPVSQKILRGGLPPEKYAGLLRKLTWTSSLCNRFLLSCCGTTRHDVRSGDDVGARRFQQAPHYLGPRIAAGLVLVLCITAGGEWREGQADKDSGAL